MQIDWSTSLGAYVGSMWYPKDRFDFKYSTVPMTQPTGESYKRSQKAD